MNHQTFTLRLMSLFAFAAGAALLIRAMLVMSESTISLLSGVALGALVAFPAGLMVMWILTRDRHAQQQPAPTVLTAPELYEQGRHELAIDLEHRIAEHVLDGSWPVVMPHDPAYEPWRVITPRDLVSMAGREVVRK